jgi:hypothetical protein
VAHAGVDNKTGQQTPVFSQKTPSGPIPVNTLTQTRTRLNKYALLTTKSPHPRKIKILQIWHLKQ